MDENEKGFNNENHERVRFYLNFVIMVNEIFRKIQNLMRSLKEILPEKFFNILF